MRMPPANFSSIGLARLFGTVPADEPKSPPHGDPGDGPKSLPHAAHSVTAIIVGAVCGIVGLALLVASGWYAASWRRKTRILPESGQQPHENQGNDLAGDVRGGAVERVELQAQSASERPTHELGPPLVWTTELNATVERVELQSERPIHELGPPLA